jgi:hypothetical protein
MVIARNTRLMITSGPQWARNVAVASVNARPKVYSPSLATGTVAPGGTLGDDGKASVGGVDWKNLASSASEAAGTHSLLPTRATSVPALNRPEDARIAICSMS